MLSWHQILLHLFIFSRDVVYKTKRKNLESLRGRIEVTWRKIGKTDILHNVLNVFTQYLALCQEVNGRQFKHLNLINSCFIRTLLTITKRINLFNNIQGTVISSMILLNCNKTGSEVCRKYRVSWLLLTVVKSRLGNYVSTSILS